VGVGIYFYSQSNNSSPGSSSNSESEVTLRNNLQSVIDAAREEFSSISDVTKRHIGELSAVSQNLTFDAVSEAKNTSYINNIVNVDDVKIADIASERIMASLVPQIDKILVSFQDCTMAALVDFAKGLTEKTAETFLQLNGNINRALSKCEGTNLQMKELSNSFKSIDFKLKNSETINNDAVANIMIIRSGIQELGVKNPSLIGDTQNLSEQCTYLLNLLG
jgi:molecular chaperone GrpE (heat shock protein)